MRVCPCGDVVDSVAVEDVSGEFLCPSCAEDSAILCNICGEAKPVRLLDVGDSDEVSDDPYMVSFFGMVGEYMAVCRDCNEGTS